MKINNRRRTANRNKVIVIIAIILTVLAAGMLSWFFIHKQKDSMIPENTPEQQRALDTQNGKSAPLNTSSAINSPKSDSSEKQGAEVSLGAGVQPAQPDGTFVSNHYPNIGGSPAPSTISSICHTTPGALCTISFTNNFIAKSLPPTIADSNGNTSWNWDIKTLGLTEGKWKITATATNGDKKATAVDPIEMEVRP